MKRARPLYWWASSVRWGMLARQGPHQVAQNSTTYVLPGSNASTFSPLTHPETARGGAGSPMFSGTWPWADAPEGPRHERAATRRRAGFGRMAGAPHAGGRP